jgi:cytoskeletal protein CcmA (bactofilin family)
MERTSIIRFIGAAVLMVGLGSVRVAAQASHGEVSDLLLRVNGPVNVARGDTLNTVWVVGNDARIEGTLREQLLVINGTAHVDGTVDGTVVVANGRLELGPAARVGEDVLLYRTTVTRAAGAQVAGEVHNEMGLSFSAPPAWLLWLGLTLAFVVAALACAYLAGPSLRDATRVLSAEWGRTALVALALVFGLPAVAVASFATGIGIGVGFLIVLFAIPLLTFLGYVVVAASLGTAVVRRRRGRLAHPYWALVAGVVVLQLIAVLPAVGGLVALIAAQLGAGALVYAAWRSRHPLAPAPELIARPA